MATEPLDKDAYRAAEVCKVAEVAPYVLKYWQTEFPALNTGKDKSPNRLFTRKEVRVIQRIRALLYDEGFTIAGAKKKVDAEIAAGGFEDNPPPARSAPEPRRESRPTGTAAAPAAKSAESKLDRKTVVRELREILKSIDSKPSNRSTR